MPLTPLRLLIDAFAFSSLVAAAIGFALSGVSSLALVAPTPMHWALLSGLGAFIIYNLDRLRDTARDQDTSPERTAFVEEHRVALVYAVALVAIAFGGLLFAAPRDVGVLCIGIGVVGLFHRRIKKAAPIKTLYVSIAWILSCVGIPWIAAERPSTGVWLAAIMLPILSANLIASNLRDNENQVLRSRPRLALRVAGVLVLLAWILVWLAPTRLAPIGWLAVSEGAALIAFRPGERYGLLAVDGALLIGSFLAALHFWMLE